MKIPVIPCHFQSASDLMCLDLKLKAHVFLILDCLCLVLDQRALYWTTGLIWGTPTGPINIKVKSKSSRCKSSEGARTFIPDAIILAKTDHLINKPLVLHISLLTASCHTPHSVFRRKGVENVFSRLFIWNSRTQTSWCRPWWTEFISSPLDVATVWKHYPVWRNAGGPILGPVQYRYTSPRLLVLFIKILSVLKCT